jgi:hypothetical protein
MTERKGASYKVTQTRPGSVDAQPQTSYPMRRGGQKRSIVNQTGDTIPTIIGDVAPGRGVDTIGYGYPRLAGPAGPVRGRRPSVEPYNWESRGQS